MSTSSPSSPGDRPSQVTFAGWLTIGASLAAVVAAFVKVSQLGSTDAQESISRFLDVGLGRSLGLSLAQAQDLIRIISTAAAVCGVTTAVLGWFVLQRSRGSRLALTVLAVPLLVAGLVNGGFATAIVAASATMLWLQPARGWFSGSPAEPTPTRPQDQVAQAVPAPVTSGPASWPPPVTAPTYPISGGTRLPFPEPHATSGETTPAAEGSRPPAVLWACVVTWIFTATTLVLALTAMLLAVAPDSLIEELLRQNPDLAREVTSDASFQSRALVVSVIAVVWSLAAAACAILAYRRVRWAMVGLLASAFAAGGLCLLFSIANVLAVVMVFACAVTIGLLLRPEARRWYATSR